MRSVLFWAVLWLNPLNAPKRKARPAGRTAGGKRAGRALRPQGPHNIYLIVLCRGGCMNPYGWRAKWTPSLDGPGGSITYPHDGREVCTRCGRQPDKISFFGTNDHGPYTEGWERVHPDPGDVAADAQSESPTAPELPPTSIGFPEPAPSSAPLGDTDSLGMVGWATTTQPDLRSDAGERKE